MNDRSTMRLEKFHRILAVIIAIFMVITIIPVYENAAANKIEFYSGSKGKWQYEGGDTIAYYKKDRNNIPLNISDNGGVAETLFYEVYSTNGNAYIGRADNKASIRDVRYTHLGRAAGGTGLAQSYANVVGMNPLNIRIMDTNGNIYETISSYKPEVQRSTLSVSNNRGSVWAYVKIPRDKLILKGKRLGDNILSLKTSCGFTGNSVAFFWGDTTKTSLSSGWIDDDYVTLDVKFDIDTRKRECFGNDKGTHCYGHIVSAYSPGAKPFDIEVDYVNAPSTYLTYHPNGGIGNSYRTGPYEGDGYEKASIVGNEVTQFEKKHYIFNGWNTSVNGNGRSYNETGDTVLNMMYDRTLYAQWRQTEFQVTYDPNGADTGYDKVPKTEGWYGKDIDQNSFTVEDGNTEELPLKRTNMVFTGWNTKADGTGTDYKRGDTFTVDDTITEDITLYAQWETAPKHYLNYNNGGENGTMDQVTLYEDGIPANAVVTAPNSTFTSEKYTFFEWEKDDADRTKYQPGDTFSFNMDKDEETLTARWGAALTYDKNGADAINSVPTDSKVYDFQNGEKAKAQGNPGGLLRPKHIFSGWDDNAGDTSDRAGDYQKDDEITFTRNKIVYAHWRPATEYNVKYALNPPENVEESEMQGTLPEDAHPYYNDGLDDSVTLRSPTMKIPGYRFDGWLDDKGDLYKPGKPYQITETTPKEIVFSAKWVPAQPYTVTYDANLEKDETLKSGSVPVDAKSPYYNDLIHDKIKVLGCGDMEREGYQFVEWNTEKDGSGESYAKDDEFHVSYYSADVTLYAQWRKELTITGISPENKVYDGYSSWNGKIQFTGKKTKDSVSIAYRSANYYNDDGISYTAGQDKKIIAEDLYLTGKDADKYVIGDSAFGSYNAQDRTYTAEGSIFKREITIAPTASRTSITVGDTVPDFYYDVVKGSLAGRDGRDEATFGVPQYECIWEKDPADSSKNVILTSGSPAGEASADYRFTVKGLSNDNYDITFKESRFIVNPPGSTPVRVTYREGKYGLGTPPADTNTYYTYDDTSMNSEVAVISQGSLYSPGCVFAGWNTAEDGSGVMAKTDGTTTKLLQPGDKFIISGNTTLYAVWKGNTPLTITGLTDKTKVYDGTVKWNGNVTVKKADEKDDVGIAFVKAGYDTKDAGKGKTITLEGINLTGADSYKYKLVDGGMYSRMKDTITINSGEITRRPITVGVRANPSSITKGDPVPVFNTSDLYAADGTNTVGGDELANDFGTPVFKCEDSGGNTLVQDSPAGNYTVSVNGLINNNYDISYKTSVVTVAGISGEVEAGVSYDLNGGNGVPPVDLNKYYTYPDTAKNSTVTVLPAPPLMTRDGCKFAGWNTSADGSALTTLTDGTAADRLQAGDTFAIQGNTTLYAVWEPDMELKLAGITRAQKTYDNSDIWDGEILLEGVSAGDDVKVTYTDGKFSMKEAGNRFISAQNLKITGQDAYKYHLAEDAAGLYEPVSNSLLFTGGEILKRPVTIAAQITSANPVRCDTDEPEYSFKLAGGTFADGETIGILDDTNVIYTLKDKNGADVLWENIHEAGSYYVNVSGLTGDNYDISYETALLRVSDEYKTPAYVIYHGDDAASGTVPKDPNEYMVYADPLIEKPQAEVLEPGDLERPGYKFDGWRNRDTGKIVQPGKKIAVTGMTHLEAVWKGNTPIKITGLTNNEKVYDGKDEWNGDVIVEGILPGDDLKISFTDGKFADRNAGTVPVKAGGISISGADADKYVLEPSDVYDPDADEVVVPGKIDPLEMTVQPIVRGFDVNAAVLKQGEEIPPYELYLPATSRIITPDELKDFGEPEYECKKYDGEVLSKDASPGYYQLSVNGLAHQNYDVNAETSLVQVWAPGMKKVTVTYRPNGGRGMAPLDKNDYAVFDDPALNSKVTVFKNTFTREGYTFTGWNTKSNGRGTAYKPGAVFRITGNTVLYAIWEKIPVKPGEDGKEPGGGENGGQNGGSENNGSQNGGPDVSGGESGGQSPGGDDAAAGLEGSGDSAETALNAEELALSETKGKADKDAGKKDGSEEDTYSFGKERITNKDSSARYIFDDDKVPLGQQPESFGGSGSSAGGKFGSFGPVSECLMHWIIFLSSILIGIYVLLRRRYIKREQPGENFVLDKVIPLAGLPLGIMFHYLAYCVLDVFAIFLLLAVSAAGAFVIHRAYDVEDEAEFEGVLK